MTWTPEVILSLLVFAVIVLPFILRQVNQYERGIKFTMGRYSSTKGPGWRLLIPVFQSMVKIDMRVKAVEVPSQDTITKDNIPIQISAVVYYKVADAAKAFIEVENFFVAVSQLAQTTIRSAAGEVTLDELLSKRQEISARISVLIDEASSQWGVDISSVEIKDVLLPESLKRTIAKAAEAERERRAVIIQSEGDKMAAQNIADAAATLASVPGALHLRTLQAINDMSSDESNTTVWMIPTEILEAIKGFTPKK